MGELAVSTDTELVALGLGSCIGLAIVDPVAGVAGLAHVVLPESDGRMPAGKYADTAVPALVDAVCDAGAARRRLSAVLVGGARMFETGMDIGARNVEAVRSALAGAGITIHAEDIGGSTGRSARISPAATDVSTQAAGGVRRTLLAGSRPLAAL